MFFFSRTTGKRRIFWPVLLSARSRARQRSIYHPALPLTTEDKQTKIPASAPASGWHHKMTHRIYHLFHSHIGVTILLSLTVFLNLVAETLPQVSDAIPLLGSYHPTQIRQRDNLDANQICATTFFILYIFFVHWLFLWVCVCIFVIECPQFYNFQQTNNNPKAVYITYLLSTIHTHTQASGSFESLGKTVKLVDFVGLFRSYKPVCNVRFSALPFTSWYCFGCCVVSTSDLRTYFYATTANVQIACILSLCSFCSVFFFSSNSNQLIVLGLCACDVNWMSFNSLHLFGIFLVNYSCAAKVCGRRLTIFWIFVLLGIVIKGLYQLAFRTDFKQFPPQYFMFIPRD